MERYLQTRVPRALGVAIVFTGLLVAGTILTCAVVAGILWLLVPGIIVLALNVWATMAVAYQFHQASARRRSVTP